MRKISVITAAVTLVIGAGCGGEDDSAAEESITKTEFIAQADEICAAGYEELAPGESTFFDAPEIADDPSERERDAYVRDVLVPNLQAQKDDIEALGTPEGDEGEVNELLAAFQGAIDELEEDPSSIVFSGGLGGAFESAEAYGLEECSQG